MFIKNLNFKMTDSKSYNIMNVKRIENKSAYLSNTTTKMQSVRINKKFGWACLRIFE